MPEHLKRSQLVLFSKPKFPMILLSNLCTLQWRFLTIFHLQGKLLLVLHAVCSLFGKRKDKWCRTPETMCKNLERYRHPLELVKTYSGQLGEEYSVSQHHFQY